jgi:enamine deaminase RidA (YjgF/YER057c/UK114 family)
MTITRIQPNARMSAAVIHGDTVYLAGQIGEAADDVVKQTQSVLAKIDALLETTGSAKSKILSATIWLADMADFAAMNSVWDAWVDQANPPARATGEAKLATPDHKVEIIIVAARG